MSWSRREFLAAASTLALSGCGFRPLYGERGVNANVVPDLASTYIEEIPGRLGQQVRNNLLDRLNPKGLPDSPRYRLKVNLAIAREGLAITASDSVTRVNLTLSANFRLADAGDSSNLFQGRTRSIASFNLVQSDFANISAERDALARAAREVAEEIRTQLAVYFSRET